MIKSVSLPPFGSKFLHKISVVTMYMVIKWALLLRHSSFQLFSMCFRSMVDATGFTPDDCTGDVLEGPAKIARPVISHEGSLPRHELSQCFEKHSKLILNGIV